MMDREMRNRWIEMDINDDVDGYRWIGVDR